MRNEERHFAVAREEGRLELHITIQERKRVGWQVYRHLRDAILEGRLQPCEALPPSRELAARLDLSRNTVMLAYERLRAEGFVDSHSGSGTFVSADIQRRPANGRLESPLKARKVWDDIPDSRDMSVEHPEFDFRPGIPDITRFPFAAWRSRLARQMTATAVGSGAPIGAAGLPGLRAVIARHLGVSRAVRANADDVFVTNGSQQAIDLITRVLIEPGSTVAVEDPGYPLPRRAMQAHGCRVVGVPVDAEGLVVDAIPESARLVYVTPSHHYPLGASMSMSRRQALLAWAQRCDAMIVEDDYDGEFRYGGRPLEPLQSLDSSGRVLYIGSLSKVMFPTLRLGFLVAPSSLHSALRKARFVTDWHTAVGSQAAAESFIADGLLARHIRRTRRVYAERHEQVMKVLTRDFQGCVEPLPSSGGLHLAAFLATRTGTEDQVISRRARDAGVAVYPLSSSYVATPRPGLLFGYGAIPTERIAEGLRRLRSCF